MHLSLKYLLCLYNQCSEAAATDSTAIAGVIEVPRNIDFQMDANLKQVLFDKT